MRQQRRNSASFWQESNKIPPPFYFQNPLYLDKKWNYLGCFALLRRANPLEQKASALAGQGCRRVFDKDYEPSSESPAVR